MHTLVYPTYLLRPPLAALLAGARRISESRKIPELKQKSNQDRKNNSVMSSKEKWRTSDFTMYHGTHLLQLGITARGSTKISELQIAFDCFDAYDAPIDVVMEKSQA